MQMIDPPCMRRKITLLLCHAKLDDMIEQGDLSSYLGNTGQSGWPRSNRVVTQALFGYYTMVLEAKNN